MKKLITCFALCAILWTCSDSNQSEELINEGESLTSRLFAPNGVDPIPNARVALSKGNVMVSETLTEIDGTFTITGITEGEHTITIEKGLFSTQRTFDGDAIEELINFILDNLPNIGVVTGSFDNIESVLFDIGLVDDETGEPLFDIIDGFSTLDRLGASPHGHNHNVSVENSRRDGILEPNVDFSFEELMSNPELMAQYDILFLNCGLSTNHLEQSSNLTNYVANGGILYATDYAYEYLFDVTNNGEDYITFLEPYKSGVSLQTEATILDNVLTEWLEENYGISIDGTVLIDEFLPAWQVVDSSDENTVLPWFNGEVTYGTDDGDVTENKDLMFTFLHGEGAVFYSSFHTENYDEGFSDVDRIMEYQVFNISDY
ncbi:hypothetical protein RM697_09000 [Ichthyenterobacterium sp. W332]|uniref:Carboxypeptidase regulatory-like domain-containing protein n=1 Tax=Microcosmobacter mediterraneus TaxID=3075607 RepID=A0ABU2YKV3_9FLAO|nr:hypothetical protein [Ichthyenterobacterium sp. W332]MDT0558784.1 hypothetical protein [Ichthyenterobacterium sp. W332]